MTDYRPLTYVDSKLQVDSAIRDEDGVRIKTNYAKKTEIPTKVSDLQNDTGFITGLAFNQLSSHPTTLQGYGITDANIDTSTGTITLGGNSITPLSSEALQNYVTLNTAQTIPGVKTFSAQNYFYGLNVGGNSLSLESSDMRFYATRKFGTDNNKNLSNTYVYDGNEKLISQRQIRLYTDYVVLRENLNTTNHSAQTELCVVESTGESYFKAPYRTPASDNEVLTRGNGVTLNTNQTIPGVKTFSDVVYIQSSTGSYREGLRINRATSGWATIVLGATQNSTSGLSEGWSINRDTSGRLLMSAKDSSYSTALFYGTYDSTASKHTLTVPGNFVATQKEGSVTKTYTTGADTNMNILARVNNYTGNASCRIRVEVSGSNGIKTMYINAVWAGRGQALTIESVYDTNNCFRYVRVVVPNNTSYYTSNPPEIQLQQVSALARTVKATILESSGDVVLMDNLTTVGNTTNRNNRTYDVNNTIGIFDNVGYVQNSGWASGAWDTNDNDRFKFGEAVVAGSLVAIASDGLAWKVRNTAKEFRLPLVGGRATGTFAANASYGRASWSRRGLGLTNLTDATLQGSAFTVPTWAIGDTIYMRGSLSNGNFKPDGTLSNAMANGYTWIPIGRVEKTNNDTATYFTLFMQDCSAYTLDSNGKLTHIDGKQIYDSGNSDTKVRQTLQTGNYNLPLLMSYVQTSDTTSNRDGVSYRNNSIYANPSTGNIQATKFNGYTLGAACARGVSTSGAYYGGTALVTEGSIYAKFYQGTEPSQIATSLDWDTEYVNNTTVPIIVTLNCAPHPQGGPFTGSIYIYAGSSSSTWQPRAGGFYYQVPVGRTIDISAFIPKGWVYKFNRTASSGVLVFSGSLTESVQVYSARS